MKNVKLPVMLSSVLFFASLILLTVNLMTSSPKTAQAQPAGCVLMNPQIRSGFFFIPNKQWTTIPFSSNDVPPVPAPFPKNCTAVVATIFGQDLTQNFGKHVVTRDCQSDHFSAALFNSVGEMSSQFYIYYIATGS